MQIDENMIICVKPSQIRHTQLPYKCYFLYLIAEEGYLYDALIKLPTFIKTDKYEFYENIFEKLYNYYTYGTENDCIILNALILELIHSLQKDSKSSAARENIKESNYKAVSKAIKYINNNLSIDLSLEAVANFVGFSPIHFHNVFKASTERTLREYVEEQRIRKAENMLLTTDFTLAKIAYECGFSSQSYFNYAFKRKTGKTPRAYAKETFERYEKSV
jgi:AraC-like DNA-binding protein